MTCATGNPECGGTNSVSCRDIEIHQFHPRGGRPPAFLRALIEDSGVRSDALGNPPLHAGRPARTPSPCSIRFRAVIDVGPARTGQAMERSFKKEVQALKLGDGETFHGEGILAVTKALAAVGGELCRRLPGRAGVAPARRPGRRRGHHRRPRRASRDLHQRGLRRRHARRLHQLPAARRGDLEIDRRHQRRGRRAVEPRLARRRRRRDDHPGRGLRRGRERDPGALVCLCDEVVDVAARSAPRPSHHRAHGRGRLRALGGEPCARDDGAAHPRLSRHRRVQDQGQSAAPAFPA